jgi:NADH dehydrogenase
MAITRNRIFITGSTSFLGKPLVQALIPSHRLRLLIHKTKPPSFFYHDSIQIVSGDLNTITEEILNDISVLVHGAAITHGSPEAYRRVNIEGTARLLSAASKAGVQRIVYISSRAIGSACGSYGDSKARAEELIKQSGIPFVIVRPAEVYDDAFSAPEGIGKLARFIKRFPIIPVPSHPDALLAPIHIDDVTMAITRILNRPSLVSKTYTLAGPKTLTMREAAKRISAHYHLRRFFIPLPLQLFFMVSSEQRTRLVCKKESRIENLKEELGIMPRPFLR